MFVRSNAASIKTKCEGQFVYDYTMKASAEVEVQRHLFATSTPNSDESSTSPSGPFTVREKRPVPTG
jgi:hypothetical protein